MYISLTPLSIALWSAVAASANPVQPSASSALIQNAQPSAYPYGIAVTNEFKWLNWDPNSPQDKKDGEKIHQAFIEWAELVNEGAIAAADTEAATFKRWFGVQDDPEEVKNVFANMWEGTSANKLVSTMVCDRNDFASRCGPRTAAYVIPDTGRFHVCAFGLARPQLSEIKCEDLDDSCSSKMRSLSMTLLHEMTHYNDIGAEARGSIPIGDEAAGAFKCFQLSGLDKGDNAQNYAWLAGEAYFSRKCATTFQDPAPGVNETGEDETLVVLPDSPPPAGSVASSMMAVSSVTIIPSSIGGFVVPKPQPTRLVETS